MIACGGTGGHLFPGIAVAEAWEAQGGKAVLLISEKAVDAEASSKYRGLTFETIPAIAKPATLSPRMLPFILKFFRTAGLCRGVLKKHQAVAVLGMGGFTSLPPVRAGSKLKKPAFVHDSNAVPGKSNRLTARYCDAVLLGLKAAESYFKGRRCEVTGTPVRKELDTLPDRATACEKWGLNPAQKTVLVMGGSQGARNLNTMVAAAAHDLPDVQFLHLTGAADAERVRGLITDSNQHKVIDFCDDMAAAYAACDISVCRSGASSLTELSHVGMPALLVPYPYAADDHQTANAKVFADAGACNLKQEDDLSTGVLVSEIKALLSQDELSARRAKMREMAEPQAADNIVNVIKEALRA